MILAWQQRWRRWFDARSPQLDRLTLTQRTVYILPSKVGLGYGLVVLVLLLAAINEQLNLGYALAFLLGGVGLSGMWLTHGNLRGLTVSLGTVHSAHADQPLVVPVLLDAAESRRGRFGLALRVDGVGSPTMDIAAEVEAGHQSTARLPLHGLKRGWMELPRIRIDSTYPLGLFRAWAYWRPRQQVLIWPALDTQAPPLPVVGAEAGAQGGSSTRGVEQPDHLRAWRRGDTLRSVAWKKSATRLVAGLSPLSREASEQSVQTRWIDWEMTAGLATEARLSRLAAWVVMAERDALHESRPYGLRLPGVTVGQGLGTAHLQRCLDALAQWGA